MDELLKKGTIQVESGLVTILDESETQGWDNLDDLLLTQYLRDGKAFTFSTAGDGNFDIKVFKISKRTDTYKLTENGEYDFIFRSQWAVISARTGNLLIADPSTFIGGVNSLSPIRVALPGGTYDTQSVLAKSKDFYGVIVFLVPTEEMALPNRYVKKIDVLG